MNQTNTKNSELMQNHIEWEKPKLLSTVGSLYGLFVSFLLKPAEKAYNLLVNPTH
jgi:hypothetical protein